MGHEETYRGRTGTSVDALYLEAIEVALATAMGPP